MSIKDASEPWNEYTSSSPRKPGDLNLLPLMEDAPSPIHNLSVAGQSDVDAIFKPYIEKINSQNRQLNEQMASNNKIEGVSKQEGQHGLEKRAMAESDKSGIIQQMGGMGALMKMNDAERKGAAMKMQIRQTRNSVKRGWQTETNQDTSRTLL